MNEWKRALQKKIGVTENHKAKVWIKLTQKSKKNLKPYILTPIFVVLAIIFTASIVVNTIDNKETADKGNSTPIQTNGETLNVPFELLQQENAMLVNDEYVVSIINSTEEYSQFAALLKIDPLTVDFAKNDVVLAQFISDGCGLVVENLELSNKILSIKLNLPEHLRNEKELMCTTIASPNVAILSVPKLIADEVIFNHNGAEINAVIMDFEPTESNPLPLLTDVKEMKFSNLSDGGNFKVEDAADIELMQTILSSTNKMDGIVNMANPQWSIEMRSDSGDVKYYYLWLDNLEGQASVMEQSDTNTVYSLSNMLTVQLFQKMQEIASEN